MLARSWFAYAQFRMLTATPMDGQHHVARLIIDINDNIRDQGAQQLLSRTHCDARCMPSRRQVIRQVGERAGVYLDCFLLLVQMARLQIVDPAQGRFPVLLELRGDESIVGIAGGVAALR